MPCDHLVIRDSSGAVIGGVISCRGRAPRCKIPGCTARSVAQCDYPVTRKGKPGTCDLHLCRAHRVRVDAVKDIDYCQAHARLVEASQRATEGRGAAAPVDGAHHARSTTPKGAEAPGNAGGGTAAPGPGAEPPGVSSWKERGHRCPRCSAPRPKQYLVCRSCWSALPGPERSAWYAARSTEQRREAARTILLWAKGGAAPAAPGGPTP